MLFTVVAVLSAGPDPIRAWISSGVSLCPASRAATIEQIVSSVVSRISHGDSAIARATCG